MELREKLADICDAEIQSDSPSCYVLADAIIAALPDMVPDLVWVERGGMHICPNHVTGNRYMIYLDGECDEAVYDLSLDSLGSFANFDTLEAAKATANAHNRAQIMAALGIKREATS